jgi:glycosyltransferase involved in cell wall biosynthesis
LTIRVGLDVTPEVIASAGVARYSRELRQALQRRQDCEVVGFALGRATEEIPSHVRRIRVPLRVLHASWHACGLPRAEHVAARVDVVHSLDLVPPPTRRPLVITVHDLVTGELPALHPPRARLMQQRQQAALERAAAIIAVSHSTAEALLARGVGRQRLYVAQNGLARFPAPADPPLPPGPFVLVVGTLEPRKGHDILLRAAARLPNDGFRLVFAGADGGRAGALRVLAERLGLADRLLVLGRVDDATLAGLYTKASLLCLPSLAEGFGLPALEAMGFGLPVLASDLPAVREVAGDAAVLTPPGSPEALSEGLLRLLEDSELREQLAQSGPRRASSFSWDSAAEATVSAYRAALSLSE